MKVILLGAGRGSRLMPLTASEPKAFTVIAGKRILDWTLDAFLINNEADFVFVSGYQKSTVEAEYKDFAFVENSNWATTNILHSLLCAQMYMSDGFYSTYTDTLYRHDAVAMLKNSPHDITLVMDTLWRGRYRHRTQHPESDGEKMIVNGNQVIHISREIEPKQASGEFTGVLKMTPTGATQFLHFYNKLLSSLGPDGLLKDGRPFHLAYVIHLFEYMIRAGVEIHCVSIPGEYYEIDTLEDYDLASQNWGL